jgi:proprotein convertase subtilisin/kexin type 5
LDTFTLKPADKTCYCSEGKFLTSPTATKTSECASCHDSCRACKDGNKINQCISCYAIGNKPTPQIGSCTYKCADTQFLKTSIVPYTCENCVAPCKKCNSSTDCIECEDGKFLRVKDNICYSVCPNGTYANVKKCLECHDSCETCSGPSPRKCLTCKTTDHQFFYPIENRCESECQTGYYEDPPNSKECF